MTENYDDYFGDLDEPDLEEPQDGRDGQPPEEGSSDEPETLERHDPMRQHQVVLSDTDGTSTIYGKEAVPVSDDDWVLEDEQIVDQDELENESHPYEQE